MPNFFKIRQFEQKNDSKNFAGGGGKEKEPQVFPPLIRMFSHCDFFETSFVEYE